MYYIRYFINMQICLAIYVLLNWFNMYISTPPPLKKIRRKK